MADRITTSRNLRITADGSLRICLTPGLIVSGEAIAYPEEPTTLTFYLENAYEGIPPVEINLSDNGARGTFSTEHFTLNNTNRSIDITYTPNTHLFVIWIFTSSNLQNGNPEPLKLSVKRRPLQSPVAIGISDFIRQAIEGLALTLDLEQEFSYGNLVPGKRYGIITPRTDNIVDFDNRGLIPMSANRYNVEFDMLIIYCLDEMNPTQPVLNEKITKEMVSLRQTIPQINQFILATPPWILFGNPYGTQNIEVNRIRQQTQPPHYYELEITCGFVMPFFITPNPDNKLGWQT